MAVIGVAMMRLDADDPVIARSCGHTDFATEFIAFMNFPLRDAFYFRRMTTVQFIFAFPLLPK